MSIIQNNMAALMANRQSSMNQMKLQVALQQLSSGYRINSAADDAAGLAISEKMRAQQTALERSMANAQDGASLAQTAEGALSTASGMLNRLSELAVQASNGILNDSQRGMINQEAQSILSELNRISEATNFNGLNLLDGSLASAEQLGIQGINFNQVSDGVSISGADFVQFDGSNAAAATFQVDGKSFALVNDADFDNVASQLDAGVTAIRVQGGDGALSAADLADVASSISAETGIEFTSGSSGISTEVGKGLTLQVGTTASSHDTVNVSVGNMSAQGLGLSGLNLSTQAGASKAIDSIRSALEKVSSARSGLGATQNRLDHTYNNLATSYENITSSESRIRDTDMAKKLMEFSKQNILSQVSTSMMSHANMNQQMILQLLK